MTTCFARLALALALAMVCLAMAASAWSADAPPQLQPIEEIKPDRLARPYQRLVLDLAQAPPDGGGMRITLGILGDEVVQVWALAPQWGGQRLISRVGSLAVAGGTLKGTAYVMVVNPIPDKAHCSSAKGGGAWYGFDIQAAISGRSVKGSYTCRRSNPQHPDQKTHQGTLVGQVVTREQLEAAHPLILDSDFPCWRGRFGNGTAKETGEELVADIADAAVLWASEESELPSTYGSVMGGIGGPVVVDGRVYLSYVMANGPTFDEEWYQKLMPDGPENAVNIHFFGHTSGTYGARWLRRRTSIEADDIILCVDAQTGLTVWKRVYPAAARNPSYQGRGWAWAKNGPFTTPCVAEGRLYTIGGHGAIYCLDAATGADVWQSGLPSSPAAKAHLAQAVVAGQMVQRVKADRPAPDYVTSLCYVDGVIIAADNGSSVMGLDAKTGKQLWGDVKIEGIGRGRGGGAHSGVLMPLGDRTLVVMGPAILEPRKGTVLWSVPAEYFAGERGNAAVAGDLIVFGNDIKNKESKIGFSAWRFKGNGCELLWTVDDTRCADGFQSPTIYQGHVYYSTGPKDDISPGRILCIEMETGKVVGDVENLKGEGDIAQILAGDGRVLIGQQRGVWLRADPKSFARLCSFPGGDSVPNNQSSHPQAMCGGRLYSRGEFNLVCWDLRKAVSTKR